MVEFCKANDIKLLPFGAVAGGFLSERFLGMPRDKYVKLSDKSDKSDKSAITIEHLEMWCFKTSNSFRMLSSENDYDQFHALPGCCCSWNKARCWQQGFLTDRIGDEARALLLPVHATTSPVGPECSIAHLVVMEHAIHTSCGPQKSRRCV
jgi:hypothetical protein